MAPRNERNGNPTPTSHLSIGSPLMYHVTLDASRRRYELTTAERKEFVGRRMVAPDDFLFNFTCRLRSTAATASMPCQLFLEQHTLSLYPTAIVIGSGDGDCDGKFKFKKFKYNTRDRKLVNII